MNLYEIKPLIIPDKILLHEGNTLLLNKINEIIETINLLTITYSINELDEPRSGAV